MRKYVILLLLLLLISGCNFNNNMLYVESKELIENPKPLLYSIYFQNGFEQDSIIYRYNYGGKNKKEMSKSYCQYGENVISLDILNNATKLVELKDTDELLSNYGAPIVHYDLYGQDYLLFDGWAIGKSVWSVINLQNKSIVKIEKKTCDEIFIKAEQANGCMLIYTSDRIYSLNLITNDYEVIEYCFNGQDLEKDYQFVEYNLYDYKLLGATSWQVVNCFDLNSNGDSFENYSSYIYKSSNSKTEFEIEQNTICISFFPVGAELISLNYDYDGIYLYFYDENGILCEKKTLDMPVDRKQLNPSINMPLFFNNKQIVMLLPTIYSSHEFYIVSIDTESFVVNNFIKTILPKDYIVCDFKIEEA